MMISEFSWVIKVLESCEFESQIESCDNLFRLFLNKWDDDISWERKTQLESSFEKVKNVKISIIKKKYSLST